MTSAVQDELEDLASWLALSAVEPAQSQAARRRQS